MERVARDIEGGEFGIGGFDAFGIFIFVEFGAHGKSGGGRRCRNELNDGLKTPQGFSTPVNCEKGKEAMFDFVPFAGARGQMADRDGNAKRVG